MAAAPDSVVASLRAPHPGRGAFSVEFFPPRDDDGGRRLWRAVRVYERLDPAFVSLTYGAGGSTRDRTVRIAGELATQTTLLPVAHLTAVGHTVADLRELVGAYADRGITNVLALRGDPPGDPLGEWLPHPGGVTYAEELVRLIADLGGFHTGVASFPEGHRRATDLQQDTRHHADHLPGHRPADDGAVGVGDAAGDPESTGVGRRERPPRQPSRGAGGGNRHCHRDGGATHRRGRTLSALLLSQLCRGDR